MAFDLATLVAYTDENKLPLIKKSILEGRTSQLITVVPDVKSAVSINIINSELVGANGGCGWDPNDTTSIYQVNLSTCPIKFEEALCLDDLETYYLQKSMKPGSYNTELPFEAIYAEEKATKIQSIIEDILWQGDVDGGSGNLALCDGFLVKLDTIYSAETVNGNFNSYTAITASNIIDIVDDMVSVVATDAIALEDLHLFVGYEFYRMYAKALRDANLFAYSGTENQGQDFSQMVPGTNVRIIAVKGLQGTNRAVLTPASNLYQSVDLLNDYENFELFYSMDNAEVRFRSKFKVGTAIAFPDFVVDFKLV
jgi:hypothetical protein